MTATILLLGQRMHALEPIATVGDVLGLKRTAAFKAAASWPLTGDKGGRLVVVPALAEQLGIPYQVETEEGS
jgi:hypothetical protein